MRQLDKTRPQLILDLLGILPFTTPAIIGKHLYQKNFPKTITDKAQFSKELFRGYSMGYHQLNNMHKQEKIGNLMWASNIYIPKGADRERGLSHFTHDAAVVEVLTNFYLHSAKIKWGNRHHSDGEIENMALEVDRLNHSPEDLEKQLVKYETQSYDWILYVYFPNDGQLDRTRYDQEFQHQMLKNLMDRVRKIDPTFKKRLLFTTYFKASNPSYNPMKDKIWRNINGDNVAIT